MPAPDRPAGDAAPGDAAAGDGAAAAVAAAVRAHPGVARLDGGPFGTVAALLPGRRVVGVRIGAGAEPVELAVVARLGTPLPRLADELGAVVRDLLGPVAVEVNFSDVDPGNDPVNDEGTGAESDPVADAGEVR